MQHLFIYFILIKWVAQVYIDKVDRIIINMEHYMYQLWINQIQIL